MSWDAIGAVAELAGAIGVIVTLVYLSTQVRQNTKATRVTSIQTAIETSAAFNEMLAENVELNDIFFRGLKEPDRLDVMQRRRFINTINSFMRRESLAFFMHAEGIIPDEQWDARVESLRGILNQAGTRLYLEAMGASLPKGFRDFLEETLAEDSTITDVAESLLFSKTNT